MFYYKVSFAIIVLYVPVFALTCELDDDDNWLLWYGGEKCCREEEVPERL